MPLTSKGRQALRARAHALKPIILLGAQGLTQAVQLEIDRALHDHELIKIRLQAPNKEERRALIETICEHQKAESVQLIGNVATIYRRKEEV